jgi:hypothetical protein
MRIIYIPAIITVLFLGSCPSAIIRRISQIIVNPIYGESLFVSWFHILNKIKNIEPMVTDCDSSTPIGIIPFVFRVITSTHHMGVNQVKRVMPKAMFSSTYHLLTPTAYSVSRLNVINPNILRVAPAIALAQGIITICVVNLSGSKHGYFPIFRTNLNVFKTAFNKIFHVSPLNNNLATIYTMGLNESITISYGGIYHGSR